MRSLAALTLVLVAAPAMSDTRSDSAVRFLQAMKPGDRIEQMRRVAPPGVKLSGPKWEAGEFAIGGYVRFTGKLEGIFVFLTDKQRKQTAEAHYESMPESDRRVDPKATIEAAMVTVGPVKSKTQTARLVDAITAKLGKPTKREYAQHNDESPSWLAIWSLGRRTITLSEDSEVRLVETFGTPHQP